MTTWMNWSGTQWCEPNDLRFVRSVADIQAIVAAANNRQGTVRVAASGHSHFGLIPTSDTVLDVSALSGVVSAHENQTTAEVWAATPIKVLGPALHRHNLALANQGDIDQQQIAGAISTGTHGTGVTLPNLSAALIGAQMVLASGDVIEVGSSDTNRSHPSSEASELWEATRLSLGAVGVLTKLRLQLLPAYRLAEQGRRASHDEARAMMETAPSEHRHFEFFWFPHDDSAVVKIIDETDAPPSYPLAPEGRRQAWSYEVFPNHRPDKHTEMEYSVPLERGPACFDEIRALIRRDFSDLQWPVEYRTLAADDIWISTASHRPTATISVHIGVESNDEPFFRACEEVFLSFDGRPHWGKVHYLDSDQLAAAYPRWQDWWAVRDRVDPKGTFLNDRLAQLRP